MREVRWIVLSMDGRHATLGRNRDPSEQEIADAERALLSTGHAGWLAVMKGSYWSPNDGLALLNVRPLGNPAGPFEAAAEAFEEARRRAIGMQRRA